MPKVEVELSDEEYKDLEEYVEHHPEEAKNPSQALRVMAGIKTYRALKQKLDPERKKKSAKIEFLPHEIGLPTVIPCALDEILKEEGITYYEWVENAIKKAIEKLSKIALETKEEQKVEIKDLLTGLSVRAEYEKE